MLVCKLCLLEKDPALFRLYYSKPNQKSYLRKECGDCEIRIGKEYDKKRCPIERRLSALKTYRKDKQKRINKNREYRRKNRDLVNQKSREYFKKRYKEDPAFKESIRLRSSARDERRNFGKKVSSLYRKEIKEIFKAARQKTLETGVLHTVDHIIPLKHKDICGLHTPWNMRVVTKSENSSKSNRFDGTYENLGLKTT